MGHEHVVALCDVDDRYLKNAANQYQDAATFRDYQKCWKRIWISMPSWFRRRTTTPASMAAMQRGCTAEKATHSVDEDDESLG